MLRIPFWLVQLLVARRSQLEEATGPVFPDGHRGYRDRNNIEADYRKVREGTGFEWVVPHVYRKTVATMLDQGGLSARMIADQLGHSRISMTQDLYMGRRTAAVVQTLVDRVGGSEVGGTAHPELVKAVPLWALVPSWSGRLLYVRVCARTARQRRPQRTLAPEARLSQ